jgi:hypothetical protein
MHEIKGVSEDLKRYRCPKCDFEMEVLGEFNLWCFQIDGKTLTSGPICPQCVTKAFKEKFPTMVPVEEKRKEDNEL